MFDRFMEHSMALWLLVSAAYPFFLAGMLIKAVRHYNYRRTRAPYHAGTWDGPSDGTGRAPARRPVQSGRAVPTADGDWTPAR